MPQEQSLSFYIRCKSCAWMHNTSGLAKDLESLKEIKSSCSKCGKPRRFKCPKCGRVAVMSRRT